jgi:hypothetical protein
MSNTRKIMERILEKVKKYEEIPEKDLLVSRINQLGFIIAQNQNKIWLRTKTGKPFAESIQNSAERLLRELDKKITSENFEFLLTEIESNAKKINEESRRRSMVVT